MREFRDKIAVVTGAGSGMGRSLALQLVREGAHVAICDVFDDTLAQTLDACLKLAGPAQTVTARRCDVADEAQVLAFRDDVLQRHGSEHVDLLFNNAGIGGGGSFVNEPRAAWERTFNVCWFGVYYCTRAFLPLLIASRQACLVNVSSVNGFFAVGVDAPHTAYSTAKFAVKGFTEGLYTDLAMNAPHVKVMLVMPGHIGTSIVTNTMRSFGQPTPAELAARDVGVLRAWLDGRVPGVDVKTLDDAQLVALAETRMNSFRDRAPLTPDEAAAIILDGVRSERWRVLVGADAHRLDEFARNHPEQLYEPEFRARIRTALEEERLKVLAKKRAAAPTEP